MALSSASLLDLKAELLKKSEEVKKEKLRKASKGKDLRAAAKKPSVFSRKNVGVLQRAQRDLEAKAENEDVMSLSRKKLEAKTRMYEKLNCDSGVISHDGSQGFLVDFEQKSIRNISQKREHERKRQEEKEREEDEKALQEEIEEPEDSAEQWVDFVDSFGRSRRCLRKDLPDLQKMDRAVQRTNKSESENPDKNDEIKKPDLMSADMYRELVRQKWEEEERQNMANPDGPLHYANVQFDEVRTHGVGYYQFDKDHGAREEQLSALKDLREKTKDLREKKEKFKQKRKAVLKERLAKVKQRKLIKEGKCASEPDADSASSEDEEHMIGPQLADMAKGEGRASPELLTRDESLRAGKPVRDWDLGKEKDVFDEEKWLDQRRENRDQDFAPPTFYYDQQPIKNKKPKTNQNAKSKYAFFEAKPNISTKTEASNEVKKDPMALLEETVNSDIPHVSGYLSKTADSSIIESIKQIRHEVESDTFVSRSRDDNQVEKYSSSSPLNQGGNKNLQIPQETLLLPPPPPPPPAPPPSSTEPKELAHLSAMSYDVNTNPASFHGIPHVQTNVPPPPLPPVPSTYSQINYGQAVDTNYSSTIFSANVAYNELDQSCQEGTSHLNQPLAFETSEISDKTEETLPTRTKTAHISAAPVKYDRFTRPLERPRYERVNLYELPEELPAPPSAGNITVYPSQEEVFGSTDPKKREEEMRKNWHKQFQTSSRLKRKDDVHDTKNMENKAPIERLKSKDIPFVSPYVQKESNDSETEENTLEFDPSKPPPNCEKEIKARNDQVS